MRLLFVKLKHIGDSLVLTPTLAAVRAAYPQAEIWVVARKGCETILKGCGAIDRLLTSAAPEKNKRTWGADLRLVRELREQQFDYAFELTDGDRGRTLAMLSKAKVVCANSAVRPLPLPYRWAFNSESKHHWLYSHRVEKDFHTVSHCLKLPEEPGPLVFERSRTRAWIAADRFRKFAVIHGGTRWLQKRWPAERWRSVAEHLLRKTERIIVSAGPDAEEIELAERIRSVAPERIVSTAGKLGWPELAGLLHRAELFVGVDTAAMHLAAACQTPAVALFGPSITSGWRPWKTEAIVVAPPLSREPRDPADRNQLETERRVADITVEQVTAACDRLLERPRPGLLRGLSCQLGQRP